MAAAFVRHENLFSALKDATGLHETIGASVHVHTSASCMLRFTRRFFLPFNKRSNLRCFYVFMHLLFAVIIHKKYNKVNMN